MNSGIHILYELYREESGQDLVEYGLIAALTILLAVAGVSQLGNGVGNLYRYVSQTISTATGT
jgi:Flp pilus assembly pilin Flp